VDFVEARLTSRRLRVQRNQPYAGGFTTQRYGRPAIRRHALQIEINRALYMDEGRHERLPAADKVERWIAGLLEEIAQEAMAALLPRRLAAE
jgi:N-formylglutamate amidohydrolase